MWFLNKQTGLKWEVTDLDSIARCQNDENYEEVEAPKEGVKGDNTPKRKNTAANKK